MYGIGRGRVAGAICARWRNAPLHSKLRDNLGSVVLALVLALIVWVNAIYQNDRPYEEFFPEQIPIEILNAPVGLAATNDPTTTVRVKVRAFSSRWAALTTTDFSATMDWASLVEGMNTVPVEVTCADPTVTIISVHPQTIYVRLERIRRVAKDITVELQDRNEMPLGYSIGDPEVEPASVTVEGPASSVDRVSQVQLPLSLLNQRTHHRAGCGPGGAG
jgi:YbbR domain-containing protein